MDETEKRTQAWVGDAVLALFAREWILENRGGAPFFKAMRRRDRSLEIEQVGRQLRSLMSWIDSKEV